MSNGKIISAGWVHNKKIPAIAGIVCMLLWLLFIPRIKGFTDDLNCWINWADAIRENGLRNVYDTDTNYLPLYHYVLWIGAKLAPDREFLIRNVFALRYITLFVDIAGLWILYKWIDRKVSFPVILIVSLCNLAYVYDNVIWGQVDGILATLAFTALYCVYNRSFTWAAVWLSLMLNFKLQGIVFLPLYGLLLLAQNDLRKWPLRIVQQLSILVVMEVLILMPFMLKDGGLEQVAQTLSSLVGYVPKVSSLAYNCWTFLLGANADNTPDTALVFAGLSYKQLGILLFVVTGFISLWPLLRYVAVRRIMGRACALPKESIWIMAALIALLFFYFNTQMHERYSYPAFIFIAAYSFYRKDFIPYILFSFAFFMNMEFVLHWLKPDNYKTAIFNRTLISGVYGVVIVYLWYRLYTSLRGREKTTEM